MPPSAAFSSSAPTGSRMWPNRGTAPSPRGGIVDFPTPGAPAWSQTRLRPLAAMGVQVFKTDFAEGVPADSVAYNGMSGTELHNIYSLLFNDAVSAVTREAHGHAMIWGRSSYLGGQRHAAQWGGDTM